LPSGVSGALRSLSHEDPRTPAETAGRPSRWKELERRGDGGGGGRGPPPAAGGDAKRAGGGEGGEGWSVSLIINDRAVHRAYPPRANKESRGDAVVLRRGGRGAEGEGDEIPRDDLPSSSGPPPHPPVIL